MPSTKRKVEAIHDVPDKKFKPSPPEKRNKSILQKEEPAFPRGGASVLTPLEHKQIQIQAKQDALFEQSTGKKARPSDWADDENEVASASERDSAPAPARRKPSVSATKGKKQKTRKAIVERTLRIEGLSYKVREHAVSSASIAKSFVAFSSWFHGSWSSHTDQQI